MKVATISAHQVNFKDENMYIPPSYSEHDAMREMSKEGYVLKGSIAKDAFEKFYDDIDNRLKETAKPPKGVWHHNYIQGEGFNDRKIKYVVEKWDMSKKDFATLLTKFWDDNKSSSFKDVKLAITNFLTNREGLAKPSFWQIFSTKFTEYNMKSNILENVTNLFLKAGKHTLK